jgi:hypothetical protein
MRTLAGIAATGAALLAAAAPAMAARPLDTGLLDSGYGIADPVAETFLFDGATAAGARYAKIGVAWRGLTTGVPADASDPADPAYDFAYVDRAVRDSAARGLEPLLFITGAPDFAEGPARPNDVDPGTWRPDPDALAAFAHAVATRYSGSFVADGSALPRVRYYQAWTEPNLSIHLAPQYERGRLVAPALFRALLNAFYAAVKAVHPDNVVITAGTAPYGDDPPNADRTRPLTFWRDVLCLNAANRPLACPIKASFDVLAHQPINTTGPPRQPAVDPDDATVADFGELRAILRAAEAAGTIGTPGRHQLWSTEMWWETNPPDPVQGISPRLQARWLEQAIYLLWKQGARVVIYQGIRDTAYHPDVFDELSGSGIYFKDGSPKPALTAFRFPFVVSRVKGRRLIAWGRAPVGGKLVIKSRARRRWRLVRSLRLEAGAVFKAKLPREPGRRLRADIGGERSLVWRRR